MSSFSTYRVNYAQGEQFVYFRDNTGWERGMPVSDDAKKGIADLSQWALEISKSIGQRVVLVADVLPSSRGWYDNDDKRQISFTLVVEV